jgi:hypothetical protein
MNCMKISPPIIIEYNNPLYKQKNSTIDTQKYLYFLERKLPVQCFNCGFSFNQLEKSSYNKFCSGECYYSYTIRKKFHIEK